MFSSVGRRSDGKSRWSFGVSLAGHFVILLLVVFYHSRPIFVTPSSLAMGNRDRSYRPVYFAPVGATNQPDPDEHKSLLSPRTRMTAIRRHKQQTAQEQANVADKVDDQNKEARAGTAYGSLYVGPAEGHDVRPAYPVIFPDPPVSHSDFPSGFQGDVVVEVSIDKNGNVIDLRLLQGIGRGIDEKVLATLRNWHYKPATMDGEPIAEKHDVHFHYPG